jgi:hypothetical protein
MYCKNGNPQSEIPPPHRFILAPLLSYLPI